MAEVDNEKYTYYDLFCWLSYLNIYLTSWKNEFLSNKRKYKFLTNILDLLSNNFIHNLLKVYIQ